MLSVNIPDKTRHQNDHSVSHLTQCLLLHYLRKADQALRYALKYTKTRKNIADIIDRSFKKTNRF